MILTFTGYTVLDAGTQLQFVSPDPGPGRPSDYAVLVTDAEMAAVTTAQQLRDLVLAKLQRKLLAALVASRLDGFLGQSVTL